MPTDGSVGGFQPRDVLVSVYRPDRIYYYFAGMSLENTLKSDVSDVKSGITEHPPIFVTSARGVSRMALKVFEIDHDALFDDDRDEKVLAGVVRDGVYRGDRDLGLMVGSYGFEREETIRRALTNQHVWTTKVDRAAVESVWDNDWETELTEDDM